MSARSPTSSRSSPTRDCVSRREVRSWATMGSPMISPTRMPGLSELKGSWETSTEVISAVDIGKLAGLVEGEGSLRLAFGGGRHFRRTTPQITVLMTDRDVVEWVAAMWGSKVRGPYRPKGFKTALQSQLHHVGYRLQGS